MDAAIIDRIETGMERGASALFAAAVCFAAYAFAGTAGVEPRLAFAAAGAGALAYLPCSWLLSLTGRRPRSFEVRFYAARDLELVDAPGELLLTDRLQPEELLLTERVEPDELLLSEADRVGSDAPLDLNDILEEIGPDSRVVRLFDRKAMAAPTPGQLQSRISEHMKGGTSRSAPPNLAGPSDASKALSEALAELRRSLR